MGIWKKIKSWFIKSEKAVEPTVETSVETIINDTPIIEEKVTTAKEIKAKVKKTSDKVSKPAQKSSKPKTKTKPKSKKSED